MSIGKRLILLMKHLKMKVPEFAETIGTKERTMRNWMKGVGEPGLESINKMIELGASRVWVLTGEGEMIATVSSDSKKDAPVSKDDYLILQGRFLQIKDDFDTLVRGIGTTLDDCKSAIKAHAVSSPDSDKNRSRETVLH